MVRGTAERKKMQQAAPEALNRILTRPELIGLAGSVTFGLGSAPRPWLFELAPAHLPHQVTVDPALFTEPADAALVLAFAGEMALWRSHGADGHQAMLAAAESVRRLSESLPPRAGLAAVPDWLARLQDQAAGGGLAPELEPLAAPTAWLMLQNCDPRLDLDPVSRRNRYGCTALPQENAVELDSCTAASTSRNGWRAAEGLRRTLIGTALGGGLEDGLTATGRRIAAQLAAALGVAGRVQPVLAASGTTTALLALALCRREPERPTEVLILGAEETGSGTPASVGGRHSAVRAPSGAAVRPGAPVDGLIAPTVTDIPIRGDGGQPVPETALLATIEGYIARAAAENRGIVLHAVDVSKTGLAAPGVEAVAELKRRHGRSLAVIVDSCQMRVTKEILGRYVDAGCLVAVTGSKFLGGPPFSGALLVPPAMLAEAPPLAGGLAAYSWRGDWPAGCDHLTAALPAGGSPGLYLRWQAALADWALFAAMPPSKVEAGFRAFAEAVQRQLAGRPWLRLAPGPSGAGIFTIGVAHPRSPGWLGEPELRRLHALLGLDAGSLLPAAERPHARRLCHIGQPVSVTGWGAGLRLAAGARQMVAFGDDGEAWETTVATVLEKLQMLLSHL